MMTDSKRPGDNPKSSVADIRARFDNDVERFSNFETGQTSTVDAALAMRLVAASAAAATPRARAVLDVGCGAGNYTLALLEHLPGLDVTLVDLSRPMLDCAVERVTDAGAGKVTAVQGDIREVELGAGKHDIILAAAVLHHLRTDAEWVDTFARFYALLRSGGGIWIFDLVRHSIAAIEALMWTRYGDYLSELKDVAYRDHVFDYIEQEDTPRPLLEQIDTLRQVGFSQIDILHKNTSFAAFGATRA